jgi:hypothetical protein
LVLFCPVRLALHGFSKDIKKLLGYNVKTIFHPKRGGEQDSK